jgi:hypothetical protein
MVRALELCSTCIVLTLFDKVVRVQFSFYRARPFSAYEPLVINWHAGKRCRAYFLHGFVRFFEIDISSTHQNCAVLKAPAINITRMLIMHIAYVCLVALQRLSHLTISIGGGCPKHRRQHVPERRLELALRSCTSCPLAAVA